MSNKTFNIRNWKKEKLHWGSPNIFMKVRKNWKRKGKKERKFLPSSWKYLSQAVGWGEENKPEGRWGFKNGKGLGCKWRPKAIRLNGIIHGDNIFWLLIGGAQVYLNNLKYTRFQMFSMLREKKSTFFIVISIQYCLIYFLSTKNQDMTVKIIFFLLSRIISNIQGLDKLLYIVLVTKYHNIVVITSKEDSCVNHVAYLQEFWNFWVWKTKHIRSRFKTPFRFNFSFTIRTAYFHLPNSFVYFIPANRWGGPLKLQKNCRTKRVKLH